MILAARRTRIPIWRHARHRLVLAQVVVGVVVLGVVLLVARDVAANLAAHGVRTGFGFLGQRAGFQITPALIPFSEDSSYVRAFLVGLLNTLLVTALAIPFATLLGFPMGMATLLPGRGLRGLVRAYVETVRNIPPIIQLFFWYFVVFRALPPPRQGWSLSGLVFLNGRGLSVPVPAAGPGGWHWDLPHLAGFNVSGGATLTPELLALVLTLSLYQAAYIAETVRGGVRAIPAGQVEAGLALGLRRGVVLRRVVLPQVLRVVRPPLTSIYVNVLKGSTLAAAIAYPDLVSVFAGSVLNLTGQALEIMLVTGCTYLAVSLLIAAVMGARDHPMLAGIR